MRILATLIAIDTNGHIVTAAVAARSEPGHYYCHLCHCPVNLSSLDHYPGPWFEHNQQLSPTEKLKQCPYFDPEEKESAKEKELRLLVRRMMPTVCLVNWHCRLCGHDYTGEKHCITCHTGIYSIGTHNDERMT